MDIVHVVKVKKGFIKCVWSAHKYWCVTGYVTILPSSFCFRTSSLQAVRDQQGRLIVRSVLALNMYSIPDTCDHTSSQG